MANNVVACQMNGNSNFFLVSEKKVKKKDQADLPQPIAASQGGAGVCQSRISTKAVYIIVNISCDKVMFSVIYPGQPITLHTRG